VGGGRGRGLGTRQVHLDQAPRPLLPREHPRHPQPLHLAPLRHGKQFQVGGEPAGAVLGIGFHVQVRGARHGPRGQRQAVEGGAQPVGAQQGAPVVGPRPHHVRRSHRGQRIDGAAAVAAQERLAKGSHARGDLLLGVALLHGAGVARVQHLRRGLVDLAGGQRQQGGGQGQSVHGCGPGAGARSV
ncbi:MAG: hypothetical protein AVDCRST_MAG89-2340, partial [uncultured Gemmatimonadetes bacterium]